MKIAIIADTHVPHKFDALADRLLAGLPGVDLILHCGDIVEPVVLEQLEKFAPVEAVAGNHDLERFGTTLPRKKILELGGYRIGMIHGDELNGLHVNRTQQRELLHQVLTEPFVRENPLDCIVFGHGHRPVIDSVRITFRPPGKMGAKIKQDVLLFSPGMSSRNRHLSSMGYLYLEDDAIRAEVKVFTFSRSLIRCQGEVK